MRKILISLITIAALSTAAFAATRAYFSDGELLGSNTFSTGTVDLDKSYMWGFPINLTNIAPGVSQSKAVTIRYRGTLNANMFLGVTGNRGPGDTGYIADVLNVKIEDTDTHTVLFDGLANLLSGSWYSIASNVSQNQDKHYTLTFTLNSTAGNEYQGVVNDDTVFMIYAAQVGAPAPTGHPYQQTFLNGTIVTPTP
jgi:type 1 fimbria pilin